MTKHILLFGPQGSGKGIQSAFIEKMYGLQSFSMGDALRAEIKEQTPIGKKVENLLKNGVLVPNEFTNEIAAKYAKKINTGMIFDGYPRREGQWTFVEKNFDIVAAIEIHISDQEAMKRIIHRWNCPKCNKIYNTITIKPKKAGICDICGVPLVQRNDDKLEEVKKRLKAYHEETEPLKKLYQQKKIYYKINGSKGVEQVSAEVVKILDRVIGKNPQKNIILIGPQGSGKGTIAQLLEKNVQLKQFSTGDAFRSEIAHKTALGKQVENLLKNGILVPDELTNQIVLTKSKDPSFKNGIIFDGYPRTLQQAAFVNQHIKIDAVIELAMPDKIAIERISNRRTCPKCKQIYNLLTPVLRPKKQGICDTCGVALIQRNDDKPEELKKRLKQYHEQTEPVVKYFKKLHHKVNAALPIEKEYVAVEKIVKKL